MTFDEATEWMRGRCSMCNSISLNPEETLEVRIAEADAAMMQQAYWVLKAWEENLVPAERPRAAKD